MNENLQFTAQQVGERIKNRRIELHYSMEQVAQELGVNRSTVQRMEKRGIDPKKAYKLSAIADALDTTVEWLTGQSEEKEICFEARSRKKIEKEVDTFLADVANNIDNGHIQDLMVNIFDRFVDMFGVIAVYMGAAMREVEQVENDNGLYQSLVKYAINSKVVTEKVYRKNMEKPIEELKKMADYLLGLYDTDAENLHKMFGIPHEERQKIKAKQLQNSEN